MMKILVEKFRCTAGHGIYSEERLTSAAFELNLEVSFEEKGFITELDQSISYAHLIEIIKAVMKEPVPLLETVCQLITTQIKADYPIVSEINISIRKLAPPIINFQGHVGVHYIIKFDPK